MSTAIKQILIDCVNILILDNENKVWLMGNNFARKIGFGKDSNSIYSPIYIGLQLDPNETIKKFITTDFIIIIYTSKNRVYIPNKNTKDINLDFLGLTTSRAHIPTNVDSLESNLESVTTNMPSIIRDAHGTTNTMDNNSDDEVHDTHDSHDSHDTHEVYNNTEIPDEIDETDEASEEDAPAYDFNRVVDIYTTLDQYVFSDDDVDNNAGDVYDESNSAASSNIDNETFFYSMFNQRMGKHCIDTEGYVLFETYVDDIIAYSKVFIFRKGTDLYFYDPVANRNDYIFNKKLGMSVILINKPQYPYYQIVPPFGTTNMTFHKNFVLVRYGSYIHIISIKEAFDTAFINWLYFQSYFEISGEDIYYLNTEGSCYVRHTTYISELGGVSKSSVLYYKYFHGDHQLIPISLSSQCHCRILPANTGDSYMLLGILSAETSSDMINENRGLYLDSGSGGFSKQIEYNDILKYAIDLNIYDDIQSNLVIVDSPDDCLFVTHGRNMYVNIHNCKYYKLFDDGLIYYGTCGNPTISNLATEPSLYLVSYIEHTTDTYDTSEIRRFHTSTATYYVYKFNNQPTPITNIWFTGYIFIIESNNNYYYHTIGTKQFNVNRITNIVLNRDSNKPQMVNKHLVMYSKPTNINKSDLIIHTESNKLDKMLNIMEMLGTGSDITIKYADDTSIIAYGDGPLRDFIETALAEFENKYLIRHNTISEFNFEEITKLKKYQLACIGKMLGYIIGNTCNPLSVRLPLDLIAAIRGGSIQLTDLEYFASIEDNEGLSAVINFKADESFTILDTGFKSYDEYIQYICKYQYQTQTINKSLYYISKTIASGFTNCHTIKNLHIMNIPTLDYYLSGDYVIDRLQLIKNLSMTFISTNDETKLPIYTKLIHNTILGISEDKLRILIKNWTGSTVVRRHTKYHVNIIKDSVHVVFFGTCNMDLDINEKYLEDDTMYDTLIDILTTPMNKMIDE